MTHEDVTLFALVVVPCVLIAWFVIRYLVPPPDEPATPRWAPDPALMEDAEVAALEAIWELTP